MKILKTLWLFLAVIVLVITLYSYDGEKFSDVWIFLTWLMLIESFPAGLLVSLLHMLCANYFHLTIETTYFSLAAEWFLYFGLGYVQWFIFLPWVWGKLRKKRYSLESEQN